MFIDFSELPSTPHSRWTDLPDDEALLLWSVRRMVVAWPRCHAVHAALHRRFGDDALGVEHMLRCLLIGLARHATRPLRLGDPACALLLPDEALLLLALRNSGDPARAGTAIEALSGAPAAACLLPITVALAALTS